ncbi:hypothetical protein V8G54_004725 [Vigna mungo]|uniref:Uncharacterized protein n=1 Tax=Vigna mungo TaxID=3915 RepID=A0AAQ3PDZ8_VIGMU
MLTSCGSTLLSLSNGVKSFLWLIRASFLKWERSLILTGKHTILLSSKDKSSKDGGRLGNDRSFLHSVKVSFFRLGRSLMLSGKFSTVLPFSDKSAKDDKVHSSSIFGLSEEDTRGKSSSFGLSGKFTSFLQE